VYEVLETREWETTMTRHDKRAPLSMLGAIGLCFLSAGTACSADGNENAGIASAEQGVVGDFLPGLTTNSGDLQGLLDEAEEAFNAVEGIGDGVGPIFNLNACGGCHTDGAIGGAGVQLERRFGRIANGVFDPLANRGGSLRQLFTVGNFNNPNLPAASRGRCQAGNPTLCCVPQEVDAAEATVRNVGRLVQPLFGLGLVDSVADSFFDGLAAAQPAAIRGVVRRVRVAIPNPGDPTQSIGSVRVGRFGWKANVPSLLQFSADAYVNEMAITTQSCFNGTSLNAFAVESAPNGVPVPEGCDDLAEAQTIANPGGTPAITNSQWRQVDDAVGSCGGGLTEIQDDVFLFAVFNTALAPAPRDFSDQISVTRGDPIFTQVGCGGCHVRTTFRTPANPAPIDIGDGEETIRVPANFAFNPFGDFLLHDMGALGDGIGEARLVNGQLVQETAAQTRQMRTAPLWGIRFRNKLLHDGRCSDVACAVRAHDGQGAAARNAFNALSGSQQHDLVQFVRSL
jgi:CxxC motif-containing protein (DUF1111 family)